MILKILDAALGALWDETRDTIDSAKRMWDKIPCRVESETDRRTRKMLSDDIKFEAMLEGNLCMCPNCKKEVA